MTWGPSHPLSDPPIAALFPDEVAADSLGAPSELFGCLGKINWSFAAVAVGGAGRNEKVSRAKASVRLNWRRFRQRAVGFGQSTQSTLKCHFAGQKAGVALPLRGFRPHAGESLGLLTGRGGPRGW